MAGIISPPVSVPDPEETLFATVGDLRADGTLGDARLEVSNRAAYRYEGHVLVAEYDIKGLTNPRIEDLVDATALIADYKGVDVELLRTTSTKSLRIAGAEKRLKALMKGEPMPEI